MNYSQRQTWIKIAIIIIILLLAIDDHYMDYDHYVDFAVPADHRVKINGNELNGCQRAAFRQVCRKRKFIYSAVSVK